MKFQKMKQLEPELVRLEASAGFAGRHGAAWDTTFAALYQALTKAVGSGAACEALQHYTCYETALVALHAAWAAGREETSPGAGGVESLESTAGRPSAPFTQTRAN